MKTQTLAGLVLTLVLAPAVRAADPLIDHQPVPCSLPGKHARICATIADDGTIKRARIYFRAQGEAAYYWSEMTLDFRNYCATLPVAEDAVPVVEYHIWAIDDELRTQRTLDFEMAVDPGTSCPNPVIDQDPERTSSLVVHATTRKQGKKLRFFRSDGVDYRRVKK